MIIDIGLIFIFLCLSWVCAKLVNKDFFRDTELSETTIRDWFITAVFFAFMLGWASYSEMWRSV